MAWTSLRQFLGVTSKGQLTRKSQINPQYLRNWQPYTPQIRSVFLIIRKKQVKNVTLEGVTRGKISYHMEQEFNPHKG